MSSGTDGEPLVFISHTHADEDLAAAITTLLTNGLGLSPDEILQSSSRTSRLRGGGRLNEKVLEKLQGAAVGVVLLTPASVDKWWPAHELGVLWSRGVPYILVGVEVNPNALGGLAAGEHVPELEQAADDILELVQGALEDAGHPRKGKQYATHGQVFSETVRAASERYRSGAAAAAPAEVTEAALAEDEREAADLGANVAERIATAPARFHALLEELADRLQREVGCRLQAPASQRGDYINVFSTTGRRSRVAYFKMTDSRESRGPRVEVYCDPSHASSHPPASTKLSRNTGEALNPQLFLADPGAVDATIALVEIAVQEVQLPA
jgi:hypothetical protein